MRSLLICLIIMNSVFIQASIESMNHYYINGMPIKKALNYALDVVSSRDKLITHEMYIDSCKKTCEDYLQSSLATYEIEPYGVDRWQSLSGSDVDPIRNYHNFYIKIFNSDLENRFNLSISAICYTLVYNGILNQSELDITQSFQSLTDKIAYQEMPKTMLIKSSESLPIVCKDLVHNIIKKAKIMNIGASIELNDSQKAQLAHSLWQDMQKSCCVKISDIQQSLRTHTSSLFTHTLVNKNPLKYAFQYMTQVALFDEMANPHDVGEVANNLFTALIPQRNLLTDSLFHIPEQPILAPQETIVSQWFVI